MTDTPMPPLPEARKFEWSVGRPDNVGVHYYTADQMHAYASAYAEQETAALRAEVERLKKDADMLRYWLQYALDNCDDSPEWNWGTDAAAKMRAAANKT